MEKIRTIDLYRVSERALRNRQTYADTAERTRFRSREIWRYIFVATVFPLMRALFRLRFRKPEVKGDALVIGSRKRSRYRAGNYLLDDLGYDWVNNTWQFFDLRIAARCYLMLLRHLPFIIFLGFRRSTWSAAHFSVCIVEWNYLREVVRLNPQIRTIYCGYYTDRKALLLSLVRRESGIRHVGIQHGVFNIFPYLHRAQVDEVILLYSFSLPHAEHFFSFTSPDDVRVALESFDLGWKPRGKEGRHVVYGCSADRQALNEEIITALDTKLPPEIEVLVKLHPRDSRKNYSHLIGGRVSLIDFNSTDAEAYVGLLSSVIAEARTFGIPVFAMAGSVRRSSDFMLSLSKNTYQSVYDLSRAVADSVTDDPESAKFIIS